VSDVGFTSGAIRRANADGRIQLSSVFDVNNAKLKTQLRIPMIVEWRRPVPDPKVQYWSTRSPFTPDENVFTTVVNRFAQRWNSNSLDTELGEHIYIDGFELAPDHAIKIQATYKVTRRLFYKRVAITEGQGIIHVPSGKITANSFTMEWIDNLDVAENWDRIDEAKIPDYMIWQTALDMCPIRGESTWNSGP
jgi:hypothetical protein